MTAPDTPAEDLLVLLPRLRRYARVLTADLSRADELVLETLGRASGRKQSPAAPWPQLRHRLFAVMHRLHRERLVREADKPPLLGADRHVAEARQFQPPATSLNRPDNDETLARFSRLPAEQREVLALVVLEALPYAEIADVLDVPVGTVMSRLHNAREGMRAMTAGSEAPRPEGK